MSEIAPPSNRAFGALFTVVFALVGGYVWWHGGSSHAWWFGLSALTLTATVVDADLLAPLNRAWMKLAEILNRLVSPVVLGILFYGVFAPIGIVMRLSGRDTMKRRSDPEVRSYWQERIPPGPDPAGLPHQF